MNESWIRAFAARHGLAVEKRVQTGTTTSGFAAFDLTGEPAAIDGAAGEWRKEVRKWAGQRWQDFGGVRSDENDPAGRMYLWVESIWFETAPAPMPAADLFTRAEPGVHR